MRDTYFEDGKWWVSPYNFVPEVRDGLTLRLPDKKPKGTPKRQPIPDHVPRS